jgi:leader peptidase (prepilin peptidase)/N-methyltransferase
MAQRGCPKPKLAGPRGSRAWTTGRIFPYCGEMAGSALGAAPQFVQIVGAAVALAAAIPAGWATQRVARAYGGAAPPSLAASIGGALAVFAWAVVATPPGLVLALSLVLGWTLLTLAVIDARALRLPDVLTLPLTGAGLAVALTLPGAPIVDHLVGAVAGYAVLAAVGWGYWRLRGQEGLGLGDAKLLAAAGAWLGWRSLPSVLLVACLLALAWIATRAAVRGRASLRRQIAFGAPLCLAIWIVWLYGPLRLGAPP